MYTLFWYNNNNINKNNKSRSQEGGKSVTFFEATEIGFCWSVGIARVVVISLLVHRGRHHHTGGCNARWSRPSRPRQSHFHRRGRCCRRRGRCWWCIDTTTTTHCTGWTTWKFGAQMAKPQLVDESSHYFLMQYSPTRHSGLNSEKKYNFEKLK